MSNCFIINVGEGCIIPIDIEISLSKVYKSCINWNQGKCFNFTSLVIGQFGLSLMVKLSLSLCPGYP